MNGREDVKTDVVRFYTADYFELDNWSAHQITLGGFLFPTAEHCYHALKFPARPDIQDRIRQAGSPRAAKGVAREFADQVRSDWKEIRVDAMRLVLRAKVEQHKDVEAALLGSGHAELVEDSPYDGFWGWGPDRTGENWLGKVWMEIRETRADPPT